MKILAFGASYSKNSINKELAHFAARQFDGADLELLDLNNFTLPLFTVDLEKESGYPDGAKNLLQMLKNADMIIISMAEHNGSYTAGFKNLFDWMSRIEDKIFDNKKVFLLSTSPGSRGGLNVMETAKLRFPKHGAEIIANFSLPEFYKNYEKGKGITHPELKHAFDEKISLIKSFFDDRDYQ